MKLIRCDGCDEEVQESLKFFEILVDGKTQRLKEKDTYHACSWSCVQRIGEDMR